MRECPIERVGRVRYFERWIFLVCEQVRHGGEERGERLPQAFMGMPFFARFRIESLFFQEHMPLGVPSHEIISELLFRRLGQRQRDEFQFSSRLKPRVFGDVPRHGLDHVKLTELGRIFPCQLSAEPPFPIADDRGNGVSPMFQRFNAREVQPVRLMLHKLPQQVLFASGTAEHHDAEGVKVCRIDDENDWCRIGTVAFN